MAVDADKIERIILNLLSNAIKFTKDGDQIIVKVTEKEDSVEISVKDTGVGIPEDKFDHIFERFGQVDKTLIRNKEGSEFIVTLPVEIAQEDAEVDNLLYQNNVERISIEFSDIYSA